MSGDEFANALGDFASAFSAATDDTKVANFEQSTLSLVMQDMGISREYIQYRKRELGPEFAFSWFMERFGLQGHIVCGRVYRFNIQDLLTKPTQNPITKAFVDAKHDVLPTYFIFKCYELGRMVATDAVIEPSHLYIDAGRSGAFRVTRLTRFFSSQFGTIPEEDL